MLGGEYEARSCGDATRRGEDEDLCVEHQGRSSTASREDDSPRRLAKRSLGVRGSISALLRGLRFAYAGIPAFEILNQVALLLRVLRGAGMAKAKWSEVK